MSFRRLLLAGALLSALAAGGWIARGAGRGAPDTAASRLAGAKTTATPAGTARLAGIVERLRRETAPEVPPGALPASLRGTEVDGALPVDANGNLVVGPAVRRFFDYFLSAAGEESEAALQTRLGAEIRARLDGAAAAQALDLLDRYMEYRARARDLGAEARRRSRCAAGTRQTAARRGVRCRGRARTVRRRRGAGRGRHGAAAGAVGPRHERRREGPPARRAGGAASRGRAPCPCRQPGAAASVPRGSAAARARRVARRDPRRAPASVRTGARRTASRSSTASAPHWQQRVDDYRRDRAAIESDSSLSEAQRNAAGDALLAGRFSEPERLRVQALDSLQEQSGNE